MTTQVLEKPSLTGNYNQFCHIVCQCMPKLSLCGAYKPVQCGLPVAANFNAKVCSRCGKRVCQDCKELLMYVCPRCGE
jgi:hypothetical protein